MAKIRLWALFAIVGIVVVFAAGWFLLLSPQKGKVSKLNDQAAAQVQSNQKITSQISLLKKQRAQIPAEQAQIAAIHGRIPDTPALAAYVRWISATASATHVDLISIAPAHPAQAKLQSSPNAAAATPNASSGTAAQSPATSNLSKIAVNVTVNGDYFAIQQFLAKMESADRATVISSVALQPGQPLKAPTAQGAQAPDVPAWKTMQAQIGAVIFMSAAADSSGPANGQAANTASGTSTGATTPAPSPASTPANKSAANNNAANN
jgi:Tfp pilus assembly protein PilO